MSDGPVVGVVVVDFKGGERTTSCLEAVLRSTWPSDRLRVVLVDNGSTDGVADTVERWTGPIEVIRSPENLGFTGGCNLALDRLRGTPYVALINNDAVPEPGWIEPLVAAIETDETIGAVVPKVLLDRRFVSVDLDSPAARAGPLDPRVMGVQLLEVLVQDSSADALTKFADGFFAPEPSADGGTFRWTSGSARLLVPCRAGQRLAVRLACEVGPRRCTIMVEGSRIDVDLTSQSALVDLGIASQPAEIINGVGLRLLPDGSACDRGFLEADFGQYDDDEDVFGWSGAAVLLRRGYLDDIGFFDQRFFLYYEDVDMSWRGRRRGWRFMCIPESVVRHQHSATATHMATLAGHLASRNRLLVLTAHAPARVAIAALRRHAMDLVRACGLDVVRPVVQRRRPVVVHVGRLGRVAAGFVRLLPGSLVRRVGEARRSKVTRAAIMRWSER